MISNYRPILILPVMCKSLEKVVDEQWTNDLEINNLLHQYQFGFRPQHSTSWLFIILLLLLLLF